MKKVLAIVVIALAFTFSVKAQDKRVSNDEAARKDVSALVSKFTISEGLKKDMLYLMTMKHEMLTEPNITAARKAEIQKLIGDKVLSGLPADDQKALRSDNALYLQITQ